MIAAGLSLVTFWCGVALASVFLLGHLAGWEWEVRQHLRECERLENARRLERERAAADLERARARERERAALRARLERERGPS